MKGISGTLGWMIALLFALLLSAVQGQPPFDPMWLPGGRVTIGDLDSERVAKFRVLGTRTPLNDNGTDWTSRPLPSRPEAIQGEQQFTLKVPTTRWSEAEGDLILAARVGGRFEAFTYQVILNGQLMGYWGIAPDPQGRWGSRYYVIPRAALGAKLPANAQISLTSPNAVASQYAIFAANLSDKISGLKTGALDSQSLSGLSANLVQGIDHIGRENWREASVALSLVALSPEETPLHRVARHWLRYTVFRQNPPKDSFRAGLYAFLNGWHDDAVAAFERETARNPNNPEAHYYYAMAREYRRDPIEQVANAFARAAAAYRVDQPNLWRVLLAVYPQAKNDAGVTVSMKPEELERSLREWQIVEAMVAVASRGKLRIQTTMQLVSDEAFPPVTHAGMMLGPPEALIPQWGLYDSVLFLRPEGPSVTGGADVGPRGAALSDVGTWAGWEVQLHEWNHQFDWTCIFSEVGVGYPVTHDSDGCGAQPIPSMGAGHRNSMRYYLTDAIYRRLRAASPLGGTGVKEWAISELEPFEGEKLTPLTAMSPAEQFPRRVVQQGDFLDLNAAAPGMTGSTMIFARCFIYSPQAQEIQLRLGVQNSARIWLNGRVVYRGAYTAAAKWETQNVPAMIYPSARLERGWNELMIGVVKTRGASWGFALALSDFQGAPLSDIQVTADQPRGATASAPAPATSKFYRWRDVQEDFTERLPRLTENDLKRITGYNNLKLSAKIPESLLVEYGITGRPAGSRVWEDQRKEERALNNRMNWEAGEWIAAVRFFRNNQPRDLVFLRLEAMEMYLPIMRDSRLERQILGYLYLTEGSSPRCVIVAEGELGEYPFEEVGLLQP